MIYVLALLIGVVAGLRALTALAAVSWGAYLGWISLQGSWLEFLASPWAVGILTLLAISEMVTDQLPTTPSRKAPPAYAARLISGAASGAALGIVGGQLLLGLVAGIIGAVIGTHGGYAARKKLAEGFARDRPAAFTEDFVAIALGLLVVYVA
jgi:uncharacterized membrane protein